MNTFLILLTIWYVMGVVSSYQYQKVNKSVKPMSNLIYGFTGLFMLGALIAAKHILKDTAKKQKQWEAEMSELQREIEHEQGLPYPPEVLQYMAKEMGKKLDEQCMGAGNVIDGQKVYHHVPSKTVIAIGVTGIPSWATPLQELSPEESMVIMQQREEEMAYIIKHTNISLQQAKGLTKEDRMKYIETIKKATNK